MRAFIFIVLLSVGFILLVIGILVVHPLYVNVCDTATNHAQQQCHPDNVLYIAFLYLWKTITHAEFWTAAATIAIAVFTLTLKLSTDNLWNASQNQFKLARDEFLSTHRPKIRIKHVFLASELWNTPLSATIVCVNNGTTEAVITEYGAKFIVVEEGTSIPFPRLQIPPIRIRYQLQCGVSLHLPNILDGTIIPNTEQESIRDGFTKLYCIGYLHYWDGLNRLRTTGFCRVLTFPEHADASDIGRFRVSQDPDYEYED